MTVPKESQARGSQGFPGGLRTFSVIWLAQLVAKGLMGLWWGVGYGMVIESRVRQCGLPA